MATPDTNIAPEGLTLDQVVAYWAAIRPDRSVLRWGDAQGPHELVWLEFEALIAHIAVQLTGAIEINEPVAVICANGAPFHVLVNALWRIGSGVVLIDRNWGPAIVDDLLGLVGCRTIFAEDGAFALHARPGLSVRAIPTLDGPILASEHCGANVTQDPDRVAIYATTSGTTDNPKCVAISHRQIRAAYRTCLSVHDFSQVGRSACLFDINSLGVLGVCFLLPREVGAGTTIFPSFSLANVRSTWRAVLEDSIDFVYLVPPLVRLINTLPTQQILGRRLLAFCAAAPIAQEELRTLEKLFQVMVFNCYGLTELTFAVFFGCRDDDDLASESIGRPLGIEARLVDDAGHTVVGPGNGELHITGPMLTSGYLHNEIATSCIWANGWLRTGDIAERKADGRYYIRGRIKDVVLRGGYTYYLHELEHYLRRAPNVVDACAFKGRDLPSGDELCVAVQVATAVEPNVLLQWINSNLGATKSPNALYVWRHGLPRNSNGKILRNELTRMHVEGTIVREGAR